MSVEEINGDKSSYPYKENDRYHINETKKYNEHNKPTVFSGPKEEWDERLSTDKKQCSKCGLLKYIKDYNFNCSGNCHFDKEGYRHTRPECKVCNKEEGLTCKKAMEKSRAAGEPTKAPLGTTCEICKSSKNIVYDHDHKKCIFRGWLCDPCNRGLGQCGDNIEGLMDRLNYLISKEEDKPKIIQDQKSGFLSV